MGTNEEDRTEDQGAGDLLRGGGWKNWRMLIFVIVLLAAGAMAAHSFLTSRAGGLVCGPECVVLCPSAASSNEVPCPKSKQELAQKNCPFSSAGRVDPNCCAKVRAGQANKSCGSK
jgi:hypothetical protein